MIKGLSFAKLLKSADKRALDPSRISFWMDNAEYEDKVRETTTGAGRYIYKSGNTYHYVVGDRRLDGKDRGVMEWAKAHVIESIANQHVDIGLSLFNMAREIAYNEMLRRTDQESARYLSYFVAHDTVGTGPFSILMEDRANIEEIEVNSATSPITVYTVGFGRCSTNIRFNDEDAFRNCLNRFINENEKELSEESPIIDAQVSDARIHAQMRPYALTGAAASIRVGKGKSVGIYNLLKNGTLDVETLAYLWFAIESRMNIVISGAPASGKTTMLGGLAGLIPHYSKLVTIEEEINELNFNEPMFNVVALYGSRYGETNTRTQVLNALRLRPDRIIIGEIRGEEARELFAGANLGIPFITTMHSGDESLGIIKKLLVKPMAVESRSLSMLDLSIYMKQSGIRSRVVSAIQEYRWLSKAEIEIGTEVGEGDSVESAMVASNGKTSEEAIANSKVFLHYTNMRELDKKEAKKELRRRIDFLHRAVASSKSDEQMGEAISTYRRGMAE